MREALGLRSPESRQQALGGIAHTLHWDDLDEEVARENSLLDQRLDSGSPERTGRLYDRHFSAPSSDPSAQLAAMRARLNPKLRHILHASNDIRVRSAALSPTRSSPPRHSPMSGTSRTSFSPQSVGSTPLSTP